MSSARVTSQGRVTIPRDVRLKLGLQPGSLISFEPTDSGGFEITLHSDSIRGLKGVVPAPAKNVTLADMDAAISDPGFLGLGTPAELP